MKLGWAIGIALVAFVLLQPVLILIAVHYHVAPSFQTAGELASIMGAIFTASGLIVALVALYTQANIEKVAKAAVTSAVNKTTAKINERIQTFLDAYSAFTSAKALWHNIIYDGISEIEEYIAEAEEMEPSLRGLNTWMGEVYFKVARYLHFQDTSYINPQRLISITLPLAATKGIQRLQDAIDSNDPTIDAAYALELAELYALQGESSGAVAHRIKRAKELGVLPSMDAEIALTLFSACKRRDDLLHILDAYETVPMTGDHIMAHCRTHLPQRGQGRARFVVFADAPQDLQHPPFNPTVLDVFTVAEDWTSARVQWRSAKQSNIYGGIPAMGEYDVHSGTQQPPGFVAMDVFLPELMAAFTFIVPLD
ncbi:MAG: hypothetical protein WB681_08500 [Candidatus Cybelea sp.]